MSKDEVPNGENNIAGELQFHIGCLVDLGSTLEKSLLCTETSRVRSSQTTPLPFHVSDAASVYISIIRDKFKDAEAQLIERLGEANWQRHVNVRMRMANVIGDVKEEYIREDPCSTFRPYSAFKDSGIGPSAPTQSQNAPSHRSFVSSVSEKEGGRLRVPREPVEVGAGRPFQCYLCGELLSSIRKNWIQHSLEHFRMNERGPESLDPPRNNSCCFCPQTFQASSGSKSWRARMDHVKVHQEHFGHRLAAARPDFALIEYFWQNGLLSRANYQELNPKAKAVEEDPQSISPSDPGLLVEEEVVSRASHNSGKEAVHGPAG